VVPGESISSTTVAPLNILKISLTLNLLSVSILLSYNAEVATIDS